MTERVSFPHIFPINIDQLEAVKRDDGHIWGYEVWLVNDEQRNVGCKLLIIFPGFVSSKHGHETKWEYFIILAGSLKLQIWHDDPGGEYQEVVMEAGSQRLIEQGRAHRFETGTREFVLLLEVSSYEDEQTFKLEPSRRLY
jgi:mannose-6-phosphate isomerase-like protein (cupin superfamily)